MRRQATGSCARTSACIASSGTARSPWIFSLPHGEMIALLRRCGFVVEELIEVRPPEGSTTSFPLVTLEWARQWPCEEIWKARKQG